MERRLKVYVAGKLNAQAVDYIKNLHTMIKKANEIRKAGFSVYIPGLSFLAGLVDGNYKYEDYLENSLPWLEVSDALYVIDNWQTSEGAKKEIEMARNLNKPIFFSLESLIKWRDEEIKGAHNSSGLQLEFEL